MRPTRWGDLVLGVRLAVGGRSWARLVLGTVGIGLATAVLLVAASVNHIVTARSERAAAATMIMAASGNVAPLRYHPFGDPEFHGMPIRGAYVQATGPDSPVPPGVARVPGPGEVVVSPALASLLDSPEGALLRPRLPAHVIGLIGQAGLSGPQDLAFFAGFPPGQAVRPGSAVFDVYGFGHTEFGSNNLSVLAMLIVGVVALLIPILSMVSVSSRIAGAARDRRLAALRLVGASSHQVRRIAAAESLVPAVTGLLLGGALFVAVREIVPRVRAFGISVFTSDVVVPLPLVVLVVLMVPVLAVGTSLFALRRTVIEPLGVVRQGRGVRRRLWWRLVLVVAGAAALFQAARVSPSDPLWTELVGVGASALLVGVPAMLPFLLERTVTALRGGPPAWQLAVRRLQLDSGTAARVVSGVAVVLAGAIALQTVLTATALRLNMPATPTAKATGYYYVTTDGAVQPQVDAALQRSGAARGVYPVTVAYVIPQGSGQVTEIGIASCATIDRFAGVSDCRDGDVFAEPVAESLAPRGATLHIAMSLGTAPDHTWKVPNRIHRIDPAAEVPNIWGPVMLVTPAAVAGLPLPPDPDAWTLVQTNPADPDAVERIRDAAAVQPLRASVMSTAIQPRTLSTDQQLFDGVQTGLLIGSIWTLTLAGIGMLVLALEQLRERRRPLAMLSAAGVPRAMLARSLLWQVALPVVIGVVAAIATGVGLAWLVLRLTDTAMRVDWPAIGMFSGIAVVLVLLVTAATLPALRSATRLSSLRTE